MMKDRWSYLLALLAIGGGRGLVRMKDELKFCGLMLGVMLVCLLLTLPARAIVAHAGDRAVEGQRLFEKRGLLTEPPPKSPIPGDFEVKMARKSPRMGGWGASVRIFETAQAHRQDLEQGKQLYEAGRFAEAARVWEQALERAADSDALALTQNYLAIVYQDLGQWEKAARAIAQALAFPALPPFLQAQILNTQGSLQLNQGNPEQALITWQQSEQLYRSLKDLTGIVLSQTNQAQALRTLGFYQRARDTLEQINQDLAPFPDSLLKARSLRSLGLTLQGVGDFERSQAVLQESLAIARRLNSTLDMGEVWFQLGNVARSQENFPAALQFYQRSQAASPKTQIQARLNQFALLSKSDPEAARSLILSLQANLTAQTPSRWSIYAQVNLAENLEALAEPGAIAPLLAQAIQQARTLKDTRAESYGLGQLGHLYEQTQQWTESLELTQQALTLAETIQADDIAVNWQWQQGRILRAQGRSDEAIAAYDAAIHSLTLLRQDLAAMNPDVQFSFRDRVEPIYRQFVQLLLQAVDQLAESERQHRLTRSREAIESLQLAELQNYFREACQTYQPQAIDQIDPHAAVIYPIVVEERLEVILSLPNQPLQHYSTAISAIGSTALVAQLRQSLNPAFPPGEGLPAAQKLYDWLLRPAEEVLEKQQIQTLVFALDDFWRSVPIAVLHDGKQYLVEKYSLALTPGLQLFEASRLSSFNTLVAGISRENQGFSALPGVEREVGAIAQTVDTNLLLNQNFTRSKLQAKFAQETFPIVHLATHGQFSSKAADTFILTWGDRLTVSELSQWLRARVGDRPVELLVLSACQTAKGDNRAALGLAGVAVRSGARSTLATLWTVQDQSTADLMSEFYHQLSQTSKAEALRQAQLKLLHSPYSHPYYWAPFVLIGNWR
jgi:CHAT domain-containing protein/predicted negative regulator of RcsB-dependent stress response